MMKNIKKKPLLFVGLLFVVVLIGVTIAYYYSEIVIPNRFQTMTYNVNITEEFEGTFGTKAVSIVNQEQTNTPVVVRISYNEYWENHASNVINGTDSVTKTWTTAFLNDFQYNSSDGWYYYKKVLNPQSSVQILSSIAKSSAANTSEYTGVAYHLDFNFEAIQATEDAILGVWDGVEDVVISGGNITWTFT